MIVTGILYSVLKDTLDNGRYNTLHSYILSNSTPHPLPPPHPLRPDVAYYVSGFGPVEQQVTALVIWVPLQLAAFAVYPFFKVCYTCNYIFRYCSIDRMSTFYLINIAAVLASISDSIGSFS